MTAIRLIHTADIHLGKPFGNLPEGARDRLRAARRDVVGRLIGAARAADAPHVLVAGDLFDAANPAAETWRHAVEEMAEAADLTWWLLPGNHDSLATRDGAAATWDAIAELGRSNLRVLRDAQPIEMQPGAWLLPAPLTTRRPSEDPTAWMDDAATPEGAIRIGLAHGPVAGFGGAESDLPKDIVAPDRDRRADLDWLALGDWHGAMRVSPRVAYSGAPERTGFQHNGPGTCHLVEIAARGVQPRVETVAIGAFDWRRVMLDLVPGDDPEAALRAALPEGPRRNMLVEVVARGRLRLSEASALAGLEARVAPEFCHFSVRMDGVSAEIETADLDAISGGGALREAANALAAEAVDEARPDGERQVAEAALRRLHAIVSEAGA